jgi:predicted ATP-dependent endonuclease of OLD family
VGKEDELSNIKGFIEAEMILSQGINLLVGLNNSGKSTILECVHLLQPDQADHRPAGTTKVKR